MSASRVDGPRPVYVLFAGSGALSATWASRIADVQVALRLEPFELAVLLFALAAGSVVGLVCAGPVVARRERLSMVCSVVVASSGVAAVGLFSALGVVAGVAVSLFVLGFGIGVWDVGMNVRGATIEERLGRSVLPRCHGFFGVGMATGALAGAGAATIGLGAAPHFVVGASAVAVGGLWAARRLAAISERSGRAAAADDHRERPRDRTHRPRPMDRRIALLGLFVFAVGLAEGSGTDWITVGIVDGHGLGSAAASVGYAVFLMASTAMRMCGEPLLA